MHVLEFISVFQSLQNGFLLPPESDDSAWFYIFPLFVAHPGEGALTSAQKVLVSILFYRSNVVTLNVVSRETKHNAAFFL